MPDVIPPEPTSGEVGQAKVLLVDDRPDKLLALRTVLEELNEPVVTASSGSEALRLLLKNDFAVILLDVSMPEMDGFETARLIRQRKQSEHTPIIFVTSINTTDTHVTRGYSLGAVDYIFSPVDPEMIRAKVAVFLELYRKTEQVREQSELLRTAAEDKAALLESRLHGILNRLNIGVFRASSDGTILEANPAFIRLIGLKSSEDLLNYNLREVIDPECLTACHVGADSVECDIHLQRPDGSSCWIALTLVAQSDGPNRMVFEGLAEDITDRKEIEENQKLLNDTLEKRVAERTEALRLSREHLLRSERLASLGTLAAGIAHEINNPLNAILMTATYAKRKTEDAPEMERALTIICKEAQRGGSIVKGILKFANKEEVSKTTLNINDVVRHTRDLIKAYLASGQATIDVELEEGLPLVMGNSTALEQVFVNVISNAVEASQSSSPVSVFTLRHNDRVVVEVNDSGPGIPDELLPKIFDPFFSTKRQQGGTGLGLSICHSIVTEHGGTIAVRSTVEEGTTFRIELPGVSEKEQTT